MRSVFVCTLCVALTAQAAAATTEYAVDPVHTTPLFAVSHAGVSQTYGRFNEVGGTIRWNDSDPTASSVAIEIATKSVDTANQRRDDHLRSPDFLDVAQYPTMSFTSTAITPVAGEQDVYDVTGEFTLHGTTKTITVRVEKTGAVENHSMLGTRIGFHGEFDIKRSEYGVDGLPGVVGEDVHIILSVEGMVQ